MRTYSWMVFAALAALALATVVQPDRPWMNANAEPSERAQQLLAAMTTDEKLFMVHGSPGPYVGNVPANTRLGIPALTLEDGPQGVADGITEVTAWPSALTVVASWDRELMYQYGVGMAEEQYVKGTNVMLGPMINIARVPLGGRNFESQGEDPYLAGQMAAAEIKGIQSKNVIACAKHFTDNNQEFNRTTVSANLDERTQYELYYPAFKASVDAGVGSVMCSYNRINDTWACENNVTLNRDLKETLGFKGWVMSDWGATHSSDFAANAGLDQQMPDASFFGAPLAAAVASGVVSMDRLNDMVLRMLTPMFAIGIFDYPSQGDLSINATSQEHNMLARQLAEDSTVLLTNQNNVLPLNARNLKSIAVIGDEDTVCGDGSGHVIPPYIVTPYDGIFARTRYRAAACTFEQNIDYYQEGSASVQANSAQECCAACSNIPWCNYFTFGEGNNCWVKRTNDGRTSHTGLVSGGCGPASGPAVTYTSGSDIAAAVAAARNADVAIVVVATKSSEGSDRQSLAFGDAQDDLVHQVAGVNSKTIVVSRNPGAVTMPWKNEVAAIVAQFMPGQEAGNALAAVLFGDVNPSGKLPISFPNDESETWLRGPDQYPGIANNEVYSEDLLVGYRWYDAKNIQPLFPFGHGLSYTTFAYSNLLADHRKISFNLKNTGSVAGAEVAQLYIGFPTSAGEPPKLLRGFEKVNLRPGEEENVWYYLAYDDLAIWDVATHRWLEVHGTFAVYVGSSSRDIRLTGTFNN
eukprot:TRINITY_DN91_c0_g1_i1.p1 TRINITY_DN91_c0_g1~~TRINITY_DN91_c0_g1_i1.p1  ORF type:complete len:750 (+),score=208.76 TRINITY_DN91_c0_g1_i1:38-2287(+)